MIRTFVLAIITITSTFAQIRLEGKCPTVSVVQNFEVDKYMGKWYEQEKYPFFSENGGKCILAKYSLNPNGTVRVFNQQIKISTGEAHSIEGHARLASDTGEAKLLVRFPSIPIQREAPYWVLATDYNKFAIVWSCSEIGASAARIAWILTREENPSKDTMETAHAVFDSQKISKTYLTKTNRENCPAE